MAEIVNNSIEQAKSGINYKAVEINFGLRGEVGKDVHNLMVNKQQVDLVLADGIGSGGDENSDERRDALETLTLLRQKPEQVVIPAIRMQLAPSEDESAIAMTWEGRGDCVTIVLMPDGTAKVLSPTSNPEQGVCPRFDAKYPIGSSFVAMTDGGLSMLTHRKVLLNLFGEDAYSCIDEIQTSSTYLLGKLQPDEIAPAIEAGYGETLKLYAKANQEGKLEDVLDRLQEYPKDNLIGDDITVIGIVTDKKLVKDTPIVKLDAVEIEHSAHTENRLEKRFASHGLQPGHNLDWYCSDSDMPIPMSGVLINNHSQMPLTEKGAQIAQIISEQNSKKSSIKSADYLHYQAHLSEGFINSLTITKCGEMPVLVFNQDDKGKYSLTNQQDIPGMLDKSGMLIKRTYEINPTSLVVGLTPGGIKAIREVVRHTTGISSDTISEADSFVATSESLVAISVMISATLNKKIADGNTAEQLPQSLYRDLEKYLSEARLEKDSSILILRPLAETEYTQSSRDLFERLNVGYQDLPNSPRKTKDLLDTFSPEVRANLVTEMIKRGETTGQMFARACALVELSALDTESKAWFIEQGLSLIDDRVIVELSHSHEGSQVGCAEVGGFILDGYPHAPGSEHQAAINSGQEASQICNDSIITYFPDDHRPIGSLGEIKIWGRGNLTVASQYVAGGLEGSRGIMIPGTDGDNAFLTHMQVIAYRNTENSFTKRENEPRRFFLGHGYSVLATYGLRAAARYLKGEIPGIPKN